MQRPWHWDQERAPLEMNVPYAAPLKGIQTDIGSLATRMGKVEQTLNLHSWLLGIVAVAAVGQFVQGLFQ